MLAKGQPVPIPGADDEPFSILADDGTIKPGTRAPEITDEAALKLYRGMLQVRLVDDRMMKLQRQGRLGFYMSSLGEEATPLRRRLRAARQRLDLPVVPRAGRLRSGAATRSSDYVNQLFGNAEDPIKGRQMPVHHSANWLNFVSISSPVGTQIPQAVGLAWARASPRRTTCALVVLRRGHRVDGRVPRRAQLRRRLQGAVHLLLPQQRLGDLDAGLEADRGQVDRHQGARLRHARRPRRRQRSPRRHRGHAGCGRARARRRRADADRGASPIAAAATRRPTIRRRYRDPSEPKEWESEGPARALAPPSRDAQAVEPGARTSKYSAGDHRGAHRARSSARASSATRRSSRCSTTCSASCRRTCTSRRRS